MIRTTMIRKGAPQLHEAQSTPTAEFGAQSRPAIKTK